MNETLPQFLLVGAGLFVCGLFAVVRGRGPLQALMGVELMFAAAALDWLAVERFRPTAALTGQRMALFIVVAAAAHGIVAVALSVAVARRGRSGDGDATPTATTSGGSNR